MVEGWKRIWECGRKLKAARGGGRRDGEGRKVGREKWEGVRLTHFGLECGNLGVENGGWRVAGELGEWSCRRVRVFKASGRN